MSSQTNLPDNEDSIDLNLINKSVEIESHSASPPDNLAKLEQDRLINDGKRGEQYRKHIHLIVIIGMYVVGFIMIILIIVRAYHFIVPPCWRWLSDDDLHSIERILFSGIILSLSSRYFKRFKIVDE